MHGISSNDEPLPLFSRLAGNPLDLFYEGAGHVINLCACGLDLVFLFLRNAVGADDDGAAMTLCKLRGPVDDTDPPALQILHNGFIVDNRAVGADRKILRTSLFPADTVINLADGPLHPEAEAGRTRCNHFHAEP